MIPATMAQLRGLDYATASKFGMPHIGCRYERESVKSHKREEDALCCICGAPATNAHHDPPLGMGGKNRMFPLATKRGVFVLKPALFAVCGSGTTGCHGKIHGGTYRIGWEWARPEYAELWWDGYWLSHGIAPHDEALFELGQWTLKDLRDGTERVIARG